MSQKLKINYSNYWLSQSNKDFIPNWTTAINDKKKFVSSEEAMLSVIKDCMAKGGVMVWHNQIFTP